MPLEEFFNLNLSSHFNQLFLLSFLSFFTAIVSMTQPTIFTSCMIIIVCSQSNNTTSHLQSTAIQSTPTLFEIADTFDLKDETNCAATISNSYYAFDQNNYRETIKYRFENGNCNNPTLWYSYQPIFYDVTPSDSVFTIIQNDEYTLNISCTTDINCASIDFCITNYMLNNSNNSITEVEFQIFKANYNHNHSNLCSNDQEFEAFITILCGDTNFTSLYTQADTQLFLDDMIDEEIPQCGNKPNPYLIFLDDTSTTGDIDVDTDDETESESVCVIKAADNWQTWLYLGIAFVVVLICLFLCMTKCVGIEISLKKWDAILMLLLDSLAIASILTALITTFVVMAGYEKCNLLKSKAPLRPWDWKEDWEKDSLMGFCFWIIGVVISSGIYTMILMIKFEIRSVSQDQYEKVDCGQRFLGWCIKFLFFVITFSFSAVLRPYYFVGHHSKFGTKCACVDGDIALIAEVYGAALISIILAPCAYRCGVHCLSDDDSEDKCNWLAKLIGCALLFYAAYCAFIAIASPFMFIAFRAMEYYETAQDMFTSEDFIMLIWLFDGLSNFFDLTH